MRTAQKTIRDALEKLIQEGETIAAEARGRINELMNRPRPTRMPGIIRTDAEIAGDLAAAGAFLNIAETDSMKTTRWLTKCANLSRLLGRFADPWMHDLTCNRSNSLSEVEGLLATLHGIADLVDDGLLIPLEDLVFAEAFANLLEQADYLFSEGVEYTLAAGVLGRAVLEEHLRRMCEREGCTPTKNHPTINDYNVELYKANILDKAQMQQVTWLATVGNDAAHAKEALRRDDVGRLLRDVREFIAKH